MLNFDLFPVHGYAIDTKQNATNSKVNLLHELHQKKYNLLVSKTYGNISKNLSIFDIFA